MVKIINVWIHNTCLLLFKVRKSFFKDQPYLKSGTHVFQINSKTIWYYVQTVCFRKLYKFTSKVDQLQFKANSNKLLLYDFSMSVYGRECLLYFKRLPNHTPVFKHELCFCQKCIDFGPLSTSCFAKTVLYQFV